MRREAATVCVTLKLFATYRRYLPPGSTGNACDVDVPAGTQMVNLLTQFGVPHYDGASVILVNGRDVQLEHALKENDIVAVFPALAGG